MVTVCLGGRCTVYVGSGAVEGRVVCWAASAGGGVAEDARTVVAASLAT